MGSSFIITKSLLEKNGTELMLDFCKMIHTNRMLSFDEIKSQRKFYDENVVDLYKKECLHKKKMFKNMNGGFFYLSDNLTKSIDHVIINGKCHTEFEGQKIEELQEKEMLKFIKDKINNKTIDVKFVYEFLSKMDKDLKLDSTFEFELNEDLFCFKSAFLKAYDLFYLGGYNLEV